MPKVSIIIPTYNSESTIEGCLNAVKLSQYKDFETIIIDCSSEDDTLHIVRQYVDKIITVDIKKRAHSRSEGIKSSSGDIIINIDSDVIIAPDTLNKIVCYMDENPEISALTGMLSKEHPNKNFFSQYKNLYMHYIFKGLPDDVSFLYGSIFAIRKKNICDFDDDIKIADDTALGQNLVENGKKIVFLRDLEVIHLKRYTFVSLIINDFQIPHDWAIIFLKFKGWRQLGKFKSGFAHASKRQIASLIIADILVFLCIANSVIFIKYGVFLAFFLLWLLLNLKFFLFLRREKGIRFMVVAVCITFLDNIVMTIGIISGFLFNFVQKKGDVYA